MDLGVIEDPAELGDLGHLLREPGDAIGFELAGKIAQALEGEGVAVGEIDAGGLGLAGQRRDGGLDEEADGEGVGDRGNLDGLEGLAEFFGEFLEPCGLLLDGPDVLLVRGGVEAVEAGPLRALLLQLGC